MAAIKHSNSLMVTACEWWWCLLGRSKFREERFEPFSAKLGSQSLRSATGVNGAQHQFRSLLSLLRRPCGIAGECADLQQRRRILRMRSDTRPVAVRGFMRAGASTYGTAEQLQGPRSRAPSAFRYDIQGDTLVVECDRYTHPGEDGWDRPQSISERGLWTKLSVESGQPTSHRCSPKTPELLISFLRLPPSHRNRQRTRNPEFDSDGRILAGCRSSGNSCVLRLIRSQGPPWLFDDFHRVAPVHHFPARPSGGD